MSTVAMETKTESLINLQFKHSKNKFLALISQLFLKQNLQIFQLLIISGSIKLWY
jgi:hypothetical protein